MDRDSIRRKGALTALLSRFAAGEIDVLVGTQMIAKGHDFRGVTLVGVISADVGLGLADFRAAERTFQLLTQVAGRAGRGERSGDAIIQTLYPDHYSIQVACRQDYPGVLRTRTDLPPGDALSACDRTRQRAGTRKNVRSRNADSHRDGSSPRNRRRSRPFTLLGPAPAPLARLRGEHRVQFFLKGHRRGAMRDALREMLAEMPDVRRRVTIDVDPLNVL